MPSNLLYHCTCTSVSLGNTSTAPPPTHPSAPFAFHPFNTVFFCEECDAIRCNRCVSVEISGYYCPTCLFEVPSASVRGEKNRCARNCFQCPHCTNNLSIVSSDPPMSDPRHLPSINPVGEPPFFLYCNYCRWDSTEAGITFDKPTGLGLQLQKTEESTPDALEFDRLKEHFEPVMRSSAPQSTPVSQNSHHPHHSQSSLGAITAAASSALAREIPGLRRKRTDAGPINEKDERYRSRIDSRSGLDAQNEVDWIKTMPPEDFVFGEVSYLEQRWTGSWVQSLHSAELKPLRVPLHSKQTKRCPKCRHILIKPEQKSQSIRYKIKLMAAQFLPTVEVFMPIPAPTSRLASSKSKGDAAASGSSEPALQQGKAYPFTLSFINPQYDQIQVRLTVQRVPGVKRPPFAVQLPTSSFAVSPYTDSWDDYGEDEEGEEMDDDDIEDLLANRGEGSSSPHVPKERASGFVAEGGVGVIEKKGNMTRIGGEVLIGRESTGDVKFNILVTFTYRLEDANEDLPSQERSGMSELRSFSFYTAVHLGVIGPAPASA